MATTLLSVVIQGALPALAGSVEAPRHPATTAAAVVDGHVIPMDEVVTMCLRNNRSYVIDQMVQGYVLDRECTRRGITVSEAEIDKRVKELRKQFAPATLEETLKQHQWTMAELRHRFRQKIATPLLVADQVKPMRMVHCREILVKYRPAGVSASTSDTRPTEAEALTRIKEIQEQLRQGKDFGALAARYSETAPAENKGDLGILYGNMLAVEAPVLTAAMALPNGEITQQPIKTSDGYCLVQAVSTGDDHPEAENTLYKAADDACRNLQIMFLGPQTIVGLIDKSHRTYVADADLAVGKPLPRVAATIDGHPILMKDVLAKCLADNGRSTVDVLIQNYVVDRECQRRGITVSAAEIDNRVDKLRKRIAPHTIAEGLSLHHMTMARLRYDFRQEIERTKLVIDQVKPTRMVHARAILMTDTAPGATDTGALSRNIQRQLIEGKGFAELAKQYSRVGDTNRGGDIGVLYEGMPNMDTALLHTALAMKSGEMTAAPVPTTNGYFFTQVISTDDNHTSDEDASYAAALHAYKEQEAQKLVTPTVMELVKKSKVSYYLH